MNKPHPDRMTEPPAVLLIRHGRTELNAAGRLRGLLDPPLDDVGRTQVDRLAARLAPMITSGKAAKVLTSPLRRAVQTAQAVADRTGLPVEVDQRLTDRDYGEWAGQPPDEVARRWGSVDDAPGVEPREKVRARVCSLLHEPANGALVVLVSHDAVLHAALESLDPDLATAPIDPASWSALGRDATGVLTVLGTNNH